MRNRLILLLNFSWCYSPLPPVVRLQASPRCVCGFLPFTMSEVRRRQIRARNNNVRKEAVQSGNINTVETQNGRNLLAVLEIVFALLIAVAVGYKYALYIKELHENDMWFSNIGQIEREISFRTESGLYFSYYKQLVLAPTISQGLYDLTHDNATEHLRTINILERFNVYQEVILAILYRLLPFQDTYEYVYFYLDAIFGLHGLYMVALFVSSWILSGSFVAGLLATCFYIFNRNDTTRISFTMPLRESFGFPFLFSQIAFITYYLKKGIPKTAQMICVFSIFCCTFFFTLVWQFAQFILLLQSMAFFGVYALGFAPKNKIRNLYLVVIFSIISVCLCMFISDMMLCSLAMSFCIGALLLMVFQEDQPCASSFVVKLLRLLLHIVSVLVLMVAISTVIKVVVGVESDEHIFKFVKAKFGFDIGRDFDGLLYLCEGAFQMLPLDTYQRLTQGVVFPCYVIALLIVLQVMAITVFSSWSKNDQDKTDNAKDPECPLPCLDLNDQPALVYNTIQTVLFGVMAVSTLRFKFLWTPHMCMYAAGVFCHQEFWRFLMNKTGIKPAINKVLSHSIPAILIALLLSLRLPQALRELGELKEFHDPDTVQLMNWIRAETPPGSSLTGSMQLLAGVKLCTDRHITNHPHYENKFLRERTKQVYQIYARRTPQEVHSILKKHGADYIILENSICYSRMPSGCKLKDILDMDNGHVIEGGQPEPGLKFTSVPRFCEAIKYDQKNFARFFRKVFENRTFYLYKVL